MTEYVPREIVSLISQALQELPVVVLTGLRQSGKTTLLTRDKALANRIYISLDDFAMLEAAQRNPEALLKRGELLTIDEAQRCPELLRVIKQEVDRDRRPGRFLLSGSANFSLLQGISESLAGRALYLTLQPFTRRELKGNTDHRPFVLRLLESEPESAVTDLRPAETITWDEVLYGGMPPVAIGPSKRPDLWFLGFEQTYLERDLRDLSQVADLISFRTLLRLAALRTGQILNQSELGRDAKLSSTTASRYLGLLEVSYVVRRLEPYLSSQTTRLVKSPKLYLSDSGIATHLTGIRSAEILAEQQSRGALLETYVAQNLTAIVSAYRPDVGMRYWNVQGRHEIDFVLEQGSKVLGIEVKAAERFDNRDLRGLRAFLRNNDCATGILAFNGAQTINLEDRMLTVPLSLLLS
jgi:predicted AAA+ superfamily ATPase